jgi:hypothetical protein
MNFHDSPTNEFKQNIAPSRTHIGGTCLRQIKNSVALAWSAMHEFSWRSKLPCPPNRLLCRPRLRTQSCMRPHRLTNPIEWVPGSRWRHNAWNHRADQWCTICVAIGGVPTQSKSCALSRLCSSHRRNLMSLWSPEIISKEWSFSTKRPSKICSVLDRQAVWRPTIGLYILDAVSRSLIVPPPNHTFVTASEEYKMTLVTLSIYQRHPLFPRYKR